MANARRAAAMARLCACLSGHGRSSVVGTSVLRALLKQTRHGRLRQRASPRSHRSAVSLWFKYIPVLTTRYHGAPGAHPVLCLVVPERYSGADAGTGAGAGAAVPVPVGRVSRCPTGVWRTRHCAGTVTTTRKQDNHTGSGSGNAGTRQYNCNTRSSNRYNTIRNT